MSPLPARVLYHRDDTYFGFGPNSNEIRTMTSCHRKGEEPITKVNIFGKLWEQENSSYIWDGIVYISWHPSLG